MISPRVVYKYVGKFHHTNFRSCFEDDPDQPPLHSGLAEIFIVFADCLVL